MVAKMKSGPNFEVGIVGTYLSTKSMYSSGNILLLWYFQLHKEFATKKKMEIDISHFSSKSMKKLGFK